MAKVLNSINHRINQNLITLDGLLPKKHFYDNFFLNPRAIASDLAQKTENETRIALSNFAKAPSICSCNLSCCRQSL